MSAACLLVFRTQPRLRDDCSAAIRPFSRTTTEILRSARVSAAVRPMIPPPIMTTEAAGGNTVDVVTGAIVGAMVKTR